MINKISDNLVFSALKFIRYGQLELTNFDGKKYYFGEENQRLNVKLKINKPGITFNIIQKAGSGGRKSRRVDARIQAGVDGPNGRGRLP